VRPAVSGQAPTPYGSGPACKQFWVCPGSCRKYTSRVCSHDRGDRRRNIRGELVTFARKIWASLDGGTLFQHIFTQAMEFNVPDWDRRCDE
jgi:hypothetical protein